MDEKRKQAHLEDADRVLNDIRGHLDYRLETGEMYELRALQLLLEVTKSMHCQHDIRDLMTLILDSALSFAEADRAFLMMLNGEDTLRFKMGRSYDREYLTEDDFTISTTVVNEALHGMKPLIVADTQDDEQFAHRKSIVDLRLRTVMAAPLRYEDQILGLIYVDSPRPLARYSKHHLNVLTSLADQAAVAIYNARKFETHQG